MKYMGEKFVLVASLICAATTYAQEAPAKSECTTPPIARPRVTAPPPQSGVNVQCGSNSFSQTVTSTASAPSTVAPATTDLSAPPTSATMIALISAGAGVLGAFAGAITSFLVARVKAKSDLELETKRLQANLIAAERLRWLQDIRQRLSTLYQQLDLQYNILKRPTPPGQTATTQQQLDDMSSEVMAECNMISLMLNPGKPDQAALKNALQNALQFMQIVFQQASGGGKAFNDPQYQAYRQAAFDAMTRLGVETWKQVKALK
jgi:hypothetical protein